MVVTVPATVRDIFAGFAIVFNGVGTAEETGSRGPPVISAIVTEAVLCAGGVTGTATGMTGAGTVPGPGAPGMLNATAATATAVSVTAIARR